MSICFEIDSNIKMLSFLMQELHTSSCIDRFHFIILLQIFWWWIIRIESLNKTNRRITRCVKVHSRGLIDFVSPFFQLLGNPFVKSCEDGALSITINQSQLFIKLNTRFIDKNSYNSTILSASPSNEMKQLCYLGSYSDGNFLSTLTKSAPQFLFNSSGLELLIKSSWIRSLSSSWK